MDSWQPVQHIADRFAQFPPVAAVALAGSLAAGGSDTLSDFDIYIYTRAEIPVADRAQIARDLADPAQPIEINNTYWGTEDAWTERSSGIKADLILWSPDFIEDQITRILVRHEAWVGYSTCFWYTLLRSTPYFDRDGWFAELRQRADQPYPDALRRDVVRKNHPVLRRAIPSYRAQIALALEREDRISLNHRIAGLLASYFDVLFAINRAPHPGEKRLIQRAKQLCPVVPDGWEQHIDDLLGSVAQPWDGMKVLERVDALVIGLERVLLVEGLITAAGDIR